MSIQRRACEFEAEYIEQHPNASPLEIRQAFQKHYGYGISQRLLIGARKEGRRQGWKTKPRCDVTPHSFHPTPRQLEILRYISDDIANGHRPTYKEIQHHFGFGSVAAAQKHVRKLKLKGYLTTTGTARRLSLTDKGSEFTGVSDSGMPNGDLRRPAKVYTDAELEDFPMPPLAEIERRKRAILVRRGQVELV